VMVDSYSNRKACTKAICWIHRSSNQGYNLLQRECTAASLVVHERPLRLMVWAHYGGDSDPLWVECVHQALHLPSTQKWLMSLLNGQVFPATPAMFLGVEHLCKLLDTLIRFASPCMSNTYSLLIYIGLVGNWWRWAHWLTGIIVGLQTNQRHNYLL